MKKLFIASGFVVLVFAILFLTGILDIHHTVARALAEGNRLYEDEAYGEAVDAYSTGLQKEPENPLLNYNTAQASYQLKTYEQAIEYYEKSTDSVDRALNAGNSAYRLGENTEDMNQKQQYYASALAFYKQGILAFPENVELKYNYEFVQEKLKQMQQENQSQNEDDSQDQNDQQENQQGQQNNNENNPGEENNPENDQQDGDNESNTEQEHQSSANNESNSEQENEQNSEGQQEGSQDQQQNETSSETDDDSGEPQGGDDSNEQAQTGSEIEWILEMLEQQEATSLKNNQEVKGSGKEDKHDW